MGFHLWGRTESDMQGTVLCGRDVKGMQSLAESAVRCLTDWLLKLEVPPSVALVKFVF